MGATAKELREKNILLQLWVKGGTAEIVRHGHRHTVAKSQRCLWTPNGFCVYSSSLGLKHTKAIHIFRVAMPKSRFAFSLGYSPSNYLDNSFLPDMNRSVVIDHAPLLLDTGLTTSISSHSRGRWNSSRQG